MDRAWPLADNAVCRQVVEESPVLQGFLFALHVPSVEDRRMVQPGEGLEMAKLQCEGGENSVSRIEVGCHCRLSSWRKFQIHCERICHIS